MFVNFAYLNSSGVQLALLMDGFFVCKGKYCPSEVKVEKSADTSKISILSLGMLMVALANLNPAISTFPSMKVFVCNFVVDFNPVIAKPFAISIDINPET